MKSLFRAAALSALMLAGSSAAALAQTATPVVADTMFRATTLNLSAYGESTVAPDKATIMLGVQTDAPTAEAAIRENANKMSRVIAALKRGGLTDREIQTSNLSLNPQYVYQENLPPRLTGYQASNQVVITVRDLSRLGQVVDATVNAGATNIGGINFGVENPTEAENRARVEAVQNLRAKADLYAQAMGYRVARLVTLNEGASYAPPPPPMPMMARAEMAQKYDAATQISPGEMKMRVDISATYELTR
ncbi:MAG TPA: SIMPL domain-containing protein [Caulobacteraceae bacterium]|nr:SIMPL domain-containing protein [Caulobacteraceae bacterium]